MTPVRSLVKKSKIAYQLNSYIRGWQQTRTIKSEQKHYELKAQRSGLEYSEEQTILSLREKLKAKGVQVKAKGDFHIVYVSVPGIWEKHNIPPQLARFGKITPFYWRERGFDERGPNWVDKRAELDTALVQFVTELHEKDPVDMVLAYVTGWELSRQTIITIGNLGIFTCNMCLDDKLKFRKKISGRRYEGVKDLASAFDLNLTTSPQSLIKYSVEGALSLFFPEGANPDYYKPVDLPFIYDVTFVGQMYGPRPFLVDHLRKNHVNITTFGPESDMGYIEASEMPRIYSQSYINLGHGGIGHTKSEVCLKGRDFEVPISGGLYLTSYNPELDSCYRIGDEILTYRSHDECLLIINQYLRDKQLASQVRLAGYQRAINEHSWESRFDRLFSAAGLLNAANTI